MPHKTSVGKVVTKVARKVLPKNVRTVIKGVLHPVQALKEFKAETAAIKRARIRKQTGFSDNPFK